MTATLYVLIGPETYTVLAEELGFTAHAYESWLRDQLTMLSKQRRDSRLTTVERVRHTDIGCSDVKVVRVVTLWRAWWVEY
jgi:hypothetical protein